MMAAITCVYTLRYVAELLEQDEKFLWELYISFDPEDGAIWIHDTNDNEIPALTDYGIENMKTIIEDLHHTKIKPRD